MHDAYNLCWKLAAVLRGKAGAELLNTYGDERRPVDAANVHAAVSAAFNHFNLDKALSLSPDKTAKENWDELRPLWEDRPNSAQKRHAVNSAIVSQTMEFRHHNVEFGYTYGSAAIVDDGTPPPVPLDKVKNLRTEHQARPSASARMGGKGGRARRTQHFSPRW